MAATSKREPATAAEGRRREILLAALRLISKGGTDCVTHRAVAAEADVALGSMTYYFDSREELIREAFRLYIAEITAFQLEVQHEIAGDVPATPEALIELIVEIMKREFAGGDMVRAEYEMILHAARDEQVAREFHAYERALEARLAAALETMGAERPMNAARTVLHLIRGFELQQIAARKEQPDELRARLRPVLAALVNHRQAKPRAVRTATSKPRRRRVR